MYYEVLPAKVFKKSPRLEDGVLTYSSLKNLKIGTLVEVPLGKKSTIGIVYKKVKSPEGNFKIKEILRTLYD